MIVSAAAAVDAQQGPAHLVVASLAAGAAADVKLCLVATMRWVNWYDAIDRQHVLLVLQGMLPCLWQ